MVHPWIIHYIIHGAWHLNMHVGEFEMFFKHGSVGGSTIHKHWADSCVSCVTSDSAAPTKMAGSFFYYVTYKYVLLKDARLGVLYYLLATLILLYTLVEIFIRKGYLEVSTSYPVSFPHVYIPECNIFSVTAHVVHSSHHACTHFQTRQCRLCASLSES